MRRAFISLVFFLFFFSPVYGNIYFWVDENGIKHFTNVTPPLGETIEEMAESREVFRKLKSNAEAALLFRVLKVFDGDTIQVSGIDLIFSIRLAGIDSPEIGFNGQKSQPFSQKAKQYLTSLLDNRNIRIKSYGIGGYNRQLAEVFVEGQNINLAMIRAGLAEVYRGRPPKTLDLQAYIREEHAARQGQKGVWAQGDAYISPKQWRKENPRR